MDTVRAETVAMIAQRIIEQKRLDGSLDFQDFTNYLLPGTKTTYKERTFMLAAQEAWMLVQTCEDMRPVSCP
jgi:hypothetical protein